MSEPNVTSEITLSTRSRWIDKTWLGATIQSLPAFAKDPNRGRYDEFHHNIHQFTQGVFSLPFRYDKFHSIILMKTSKNYHTSKNRTDNKDHFYMKAWYIYSLFCCEWENSPFYSLITKFSLSLHTVTKNWRVTRTLRNCPNEILQKP